MPHGIRRTRLPLNPAMRYYCTYFDRHYLLRGLALYRSLKQHAEPFVLWALCFDDWSFDVITKLAQPDLRPIALADFERGDAELLAVKPTRNTVEYYFTCSPSLPLYVLKHNPDIDIIVYLDADLYFYASPKPIFDELGAGSVLIVAHRFPADRLQMEINGVYNVGLLAFRRDVRGTRCLEWWRERCLEWCYDRPDGVRYADQRYLDDWPIRFPGTVVLQHPGAGLAPWNWINSQITTDHGKLVVDGHPLIFFHFASIKMLTMWLYDPASEGRLYGEMPFWLRRALYSPYIEALKQAAQDLRGRRIPGPFFYYSDIRQGGYGWRKFVSKTLRRTLMIHPGMK